MNSAKTTLLAIAIFSALAGALFLWKYSEWIAIPKAREPMVSLLKDPASAQTRNERITKVGVLCGEVNAKNSMGGYVGFKKFISYGPENNFIEGTGRLGESTTEDLIERLKRKNARLKAYISIRDSGTDITPPSDSRLDELIEEEMFLERWQQACGPKAT